MVPNRLRGWPSVWKWEHKHFASALFFFCQVMEEAALTSAAGSPRKGATGRGEEGLQSNRRLTVVSPVTWWFKMNPNTAGKKNTPSERITGRKEKPDKSKVKTRERKPKKMKDNQRIIPHIPSQHPPLLFLLLAFQTSRLWWNRWLSCFLSSRTD